MIVLGVDVHKRSHTVAAVDAAGRKLGHTTVEATPAGHTSALRWVHTAFGADVMWGIEDSRQLSVHLERHLLDAGQKVVRVPPRLMDKRRASARSWGKSDPIDALAVARAVLREPDLPVACHDAVSRTMKLLVDRREDLVGQRIATTNRLLGRVHELDPENPARPEQLHRAKHRETLGAWLAVQSGLIAELARDELTDINRLSDSISSLDKRIKNSVRGVAPALLAIPGCGELTAAKIVGETAGITRFKSEAAFARHAGVAPIPNWSGNTAGRMRLAKSGNRRLNSAIYRIAVTQIRDDSAGQRYYRKRIDAGDSPGKARRCLKRRLARVVYQRLRTDHHNNKEHALRERGNADSPVPCQA